MLIIYLIYCLSIDILIWKCSILILEIEICSNVFLHRKIFQYPVLNLEMTFLHLSDQIINSNICILIYYLFVKIEESLELELKQVDKLFIHNKTPDKTWKAISRNKKITENWEFEIETPIKTEEKVYWIIRCIV